MANVFDNIAPDIYKAADIIGRELVGFIPSMTINAGAEAAAVGQTVTSYVTPAPVVNTSVTPSMTLPEGDDQTTTSKTMTVSQIANVIIPWTGEDTKLANNGYGFETIRGDQIRQAMKAITNKIELYAATKLYQGASRAVGTAGTTPFASNHNVVNSVRQILADNGVSMNDGRLSLVMNTSAGTNFRNLSNLYKVNESGGSDLLRRGVMTDISGIMMKESAQVVTHTKGTGASYQLSAAAAANATTLSVDTGSGTLLAGDIITVTGDARAYVANTALSGGSFTIGDPGLRAAAADNTAIAIGNNYAANVLFHQAAAELVVRPLAVPAGGDAATDVMVVQDPVSGLVFQLSYYKGYKKAVMDISVLYDVKVWNSDHVAILMG